jgi:hypothetical protein
MRAILAGLLLCAAFVSGECLAEPSAEDLARGKALAEAGDCASCQTADQAKPFARGKHIDKPFGAIYSPHLTPTAIPASEGGATTSSTARCTSAWRATARYYPAFPIRISRK